MASGTVNIQFTERLGKDTIRVYGILSASLGGAHIGTATFEASRFGLKTIRTVQLSGQTSAGATEPVSLAASLDYGSRVGALGSPQHHNIGAEIGTPGNSFLLMGTPFGLAKAPNVQFEIIGE